jgi:hypothetical protein
MCVVVSTYAMPMQRCRSVLPEHIDVRHHRSDDWFVRCFLFTLNLGPGRPSRWPALSARSSPAGLSHNATVARGQRAAHAWPCADVVRGPVHIPLCARAAAATLGRLQVRAFDTICVLCCGVALVSVRAVPLGTLSPMSPSCLYALNPSSTVVVTFHPSHAAGFVLFFDVLAVAPHTQVSLRCGLSSVACDNASVLITTRGLGLVHRRLSPNVHTHTPTHVHTHTQMHTHTHTHTDRDSSELLLHDGQVAAVHVLLSLAENECVQLESNVGCFTIPMLPGPANLTYRFVRPSCSRIGFYLNFFIFFLC